MSDVTQEYNKYRLKKREQIIAVISLIASYVIMVSLVIYSQIITQREFDQAHDERCASLALQVALAEEEIAALGSFNNLPPNLVERAKTLFERVNNIVLVSCSEVLI